MRILVAGYMVGDPETKVVFLIKITKSTLKTIRRIYEECSDFASKRSSHHLMDVIAYLKYGDFRVLFADELKDSRIHEFLDKEYSSSGVFTPMPLPRGLEIPPDAIHYSGDCVDTIVNLEHGVVWWSVLFKEYGYYADAAKMTRFGLSMCVSGSVSIESLEKLLEKGGQK